MCVFHHRLLGKTTIALHQLSRSGKLDSNFPLTGKDGSPTTVSACVCVWGWVGGGLWVGGWMLVGGWVLVCMGEWRCL